jgi:predicted HTH domain antitoxin
MQLTINNPDTANTSKPEARVLFAVKLFEIGQLSLGKAAEAAGFPTGPFTNCLNNTAFP